MKGILPLRFAFNTILSPSIFYFLFLFSFCVKMKKRKEMRNWREDGGRMKEEKKKLVVGDRQWVISNGRWAESGEENTMTHFMWLELLGDSFFFFFHEKWGRREKKNKGKERKKKKTKTNYQWSIVVTKSI